LYSIKAKKVKRAHKNCFGRIVESSMIGNTFPQKNMMLRNWFLEPEEMKQISIDAATAAGGLTLTGLTADVTLISRRSGAVFVWFPSPSI
ncbi:hypothetical protein, partial [Methanobrevibacter gottschalkii]|uniref:hypothetical protein n=1 Tax=Methanobrevibacter gottschalkii TaxID=190974 RepID=UPI0038D1FFA9